MYKVKIIEIGSMVPMFKEENLVILFGSNAPKELRDMCLVHEVLEISDGDLLKVGGTISFGDQSYTITAVGSAANENLRNLGHIAIYFRDEPGEILPGAVVLSPAKVPDAEVGDVIVIE